MSARSVRYESSLQDIIFDIYNGAEYNFKLHRWPLPDLTLSQLVDKLKEKREFQNINNATLRNELTKFRFIYNIKNDLYKLFMQIDDICLSSINKHLIACNKLHWINNKMICRNGMNLKTYECDSFFYPNQLGRCQFLHIHKQYLFDRIYCLILYIYYDEQKMHVLSRNKHWKDFNILLGVFIYFWGVMYKYYPIPFDVDGSDVKTWIHILTKYNTYYDSYKKKDVPVWTLDDDNRIVIKVDKYTFISMICYGDFFYNECYNKIYDPNNSIKILHPTLCNSVHVPFCLKKYLRQNINIKFKDSMQIHLHHGLYRLHNEMNIEKNEYGNQYNLFSKDENLIPFEFKNIQNLKEDPRKFFNVKASHFDKIIDGGYHDPYNHKLILYNITVTIDNVIKNINYILRNIPISSIYDVCISNIQKNIILKYRIYQYKYFIYRFLNIFRFINSRCIFGRKKIIYIDSELSDKQDILIIEVRDVNLLMNGLHLRNWLKKIIEIYEMQRYGTNLLTQLMEFLNSRILYTNIIDVDYSTIYINLFFENKFPITRLFNNIPSLDPNLYRIQIYDPIESGRFIQHVVPECYHFFSHCLQLFLEKNDDQFIDNGLNQLMNCTVDEQNIDKINNLLALSGNNQKHNHYLKIKFGQSELKFVRSLKTTSRFNNINNDQIFINKSIQVEIIKNDQRNKNTLIVSNNNDQSVINKSVKSISTQIIQQNNNDENANYRFKNNEIPFDHPLSSISIMRSNKCRSYYNDIDNFKTHPNSITIQSDSSSPNINEDDELKVMDEHQELHESMYNELAQRYNHQYFNK